MLNTVDTLAFAMPNIPHCTNRNNAGAYKVETGHLPNLLLFSRQPFLQFCAMSFVTWSFLEGPITCCDAGGLLSRAMTGHFALTVNARSQPTPGAAGQCRSFCLSLDASPWLPPTAPSHIRASNPLCLED